MYDDSRPSAAVGLVGYFVIKWPAVHQEMLNFSCMSENKVLQKLLLDFYLPLQ